MMVSQPGPGVTIMTTPIASNVNPKRIFRKRLACCKVLIIFGTFTAQTIAWPASLHSLEALECSRTQD